MTKKERAGLLLLAWRKKNGLSRFALAKQLDYSPGAIYDLEKKSRTPDIEVAVRIQRLTGIPVDAWIGE